MKVEDAAAALVVAVTMRGNGIKCSNEGIIWDYLLNLIVDSTDVRSLRYIRYTSTKYGSRRIIIASYRLFVVWCVRNSNARQRHTMYIHNAEALSILIYYFRIKSSSWHQFRLVVFCVQKMCAIYIFAALKCDSLLMPSSIKYVLWMLCKRTVVLGAKTQTLPHLIWDRFFLDFFYHIAVFLVVVLSYLLLARMGLFWCSFSPFPSSFKYQPYYFAWDVDSYCAHNLNFIFYITF